MPKLPIFSTLGQAMAVFGLHTGTLCKWALIPSFLALAALGAAFGLGVWLKPADAGGFPYWWMGFVPAVIFCLVAWTPYAIRVNQLAVIGRTEPVGYLEMMFSPQGLRYLAYAIIVGFIEIIGLAVSALPAVVTLNAAAPGGQTRIILAVAVTVALLLAFFILTAPLNLIYPAASLEAEPSLGRAYTLGSHRKVRLFLCTFLCALLFGVLGQIVEFAAGALGAGSSGTVRMVFVPVHILISFFSYVTATAVPAVAYRILSGLPDPRAESGEQSRPRDMDPEEFSGAGGA